MTINVVDWGLCERRNASCQSKHWWLWSNLGNVPKMQQLFSYVILWYYLKPFMVGLSLHRLSLSHFDHGLRRWCLPSMPRRPDCYSICLILFHRLVNDIVLVTILFFLIIFLFSNLNMTFEFKYDNEFLLPNFSVF